MQDRIDAVQGYAANPAREWMEWWSARATSGAIVLRPDELAAAGYTRSYARAAVKRGEWTNAGYGAVSPVDVRDDDVWIVERRRHVVCSAGSALRRQSAVVSGRSAAILHGLPTMSVPATPELTRRDDAGTGRRTPTHIYSATLRPDEIADWFGVPVVTIARTLGDLGRHNARDAIMAADAALRDGLITQRELDRQRTRLRGWPWTRRAREVLGLADPRAESPLESITRLALHDDRFEPPCTQFWIGNDRVDFCWPRHRLVLEADGRVKYGDGEPWAEKQREQRLRRAGWTVERVIWTDITREWNRTAWVLRQRMQTSLPT